MPARETFRLRRTARGGRWVRGRGCGITALLLVLLSSLSGCDGSGEPQAPADLVRPVKTFEVTVSGRRAGIELPARVGTSKRVDLAFEEVGGPLVELPIAGREGQAIEKGELLARIDPKGLDIALRREEGNLDEARSVLGLARAEKERLEKMGGINPDLVSASMLDRTRENFDKAEARVKSLEARVEDARRRLDSTSLRAPFAGVIASRHVENLQSVQPSEPILSLQDISHVQILVDVPETIMAGSGGQGLDRATAVVRFPAAPGGEFPLEVKETARTADPATQAFQAVMEMPRPEGLNLLPGMIGTVTLSHGEGEIGKGWIFVPAIGVMTDADGADYVWVVDRDELIVHRQDVATGRLAGAERVEISTGLEGGELVVVAGVLQLSEGKRVRLWEDQAAGQRK